jgi:signal transduction histidine kinase
VPYHDIRDPERLHALLDAVLLIESDLDLEAVLHRIVAAACTLTRARYGALGVLDQHGSGLADFVTVGLDPEVAARIGRLPEGAGVLGVLITKAKPLRLSDLGRHPLSVGFPAGHPPMRSFLGVPILVRGEVFGNLYLTEKEGGAAFTDTDEALTSSLATAAGIAIDHARLHATVADLALVADRERIARDLHDTVIQQLFGVGLELQAVVPTVEPDTAKARITEAVGTLDDIIRQVRTTIFALAPPPSAAGGLRSQILAVCADAARSLGFEPEVRLSGPVDSAVSPQVARELLAVLREAVANVARHARACRVEVSVAAGSGVSLEVRDDGVGLPPHPDHHPGRGLTNMAERARSLGGHCRVAAHPEGGTVVEWRVPLGRPTET